MIKFMPVRLQEHNEEIGKQCKPVQVLRFRLLGHYPKPIEFFKSHFEEATPSAEKIIKLLQADS